MSFNFVSGASERIAEVFVLREIAGRRDQVKGALPFAPPPSPSTLFSIPGYSGPSSLSISLEGLRLCFDVAGLEMTDWLGDVFWVACKCLPSDLYALPQGSTDCDRANRSER